MYILEAAEKWTERAMPVFTNPEDADNDLARLMLRAVPENEHGNKTLTHLASLIPVRRWSLQKWIMKQKLPPERAARIVEIGKIGVPKGKPGRVTLEEFHPFVYKT
jgi:hypothetical protein